MLRKVDGDGYIISFLIYIAIFAFFANLGFWNGIATLLVLSIVGLIIFLIYSKSKSNLNSYLFKYRYSRIDFTPRELMVIDFYLWKSKEESNTTEVLYTCYNQIFYQKSSLPAFKKFLKKLVDSNLFKIEYPGLVFNSYGLNIITKHYLYSYFYHVQRFKRKLVFRKEISFRLDISQKIIYSIISLFIPLIITLAICEWNTDEEYHSYYKDNWFVWIIFFLLQAYIQTKIWNKTFQISFPFLNWKIPSNYFTSGKLEKNFYSLYTEEISNDGKNKKLVCRRLDGVSYFISEAKFKELILEKKIILIDNFSFITMFDADKTDYFIFAFEY